MRRTFSYYCSEHMYIRKGEGRTCEYYCPICRSKLEISYCLIPMPRKKRKAWKKFLNRPAYIHFTTYTPNTKGIMELTQKGWKFRKRRTFGLIIFEISHNIIKKEFPNRPIRYWPYTKDII